MNFGAKIGKKETKEEPMIKRVNVDVEFLFCGAYAIRYKLIVYIPTRCTIIYLYTISNK